MSAARKKDVIARRLEKQRWREREGEDEGARGHHGDKDKAEIRETG